MLVTFPWLFSFRSPWDLPGDPGLSLGRDSLRGWSSVSHGVGFWGGQNGHFHQNMFGQISEHGNVSIYIYVCTYVYIYMHLYIYNLATHLNLELTHHNCVGFTEGPNRYHRWLDYILILGVMKVHSTPMLYWWRRCVCVVVFVRFYLCEIDFAGPVMQLSMSLLFSWKLSRLIILTIINIAKDILLRSHLLIIWMWVKMEDLGDRRC
jgi:hypothetical protein